MKFFPKLNIIQNRLAVCYIFTIPLFLALLVNTSAETMDSKAFSAAVAKFSAKFCNELPKGESVVSSPLSAEFVLALLTLGSTDDVHSELLTSLGFANDDSELPKGESVVSSPLSAEFVLALLTLGSTDDVHSELLTSLGFANDDSIRSSFSAVSSKLKAIKGVTLNVANKVYIKDGSYDLNPELKQDAVKCFDADFEKLNFSDSAAAADIINKWVEGKTNNRIKDLLSSDSLNDLTRLVLVNALYFKGTWAKQFEAQMTTQRPFHIDEAKTINVPMMFIEDNFRYGESEELKTQFLQMDYVGGEASMVIVLPNEINGLDEVLKKLAAGHDLMHDIEKLYSTKVQVSLPKFKIETTIDLTELLPKLGITAIFDQANTGLSKILNTHENLFVSTAVQKAFIEVNEEGAEAAAATGMVMMLRCARPPAPQFRADRPFLYMLVGAGAAPAFVGLYRGDAAA